MLSIKKWESELSTFRVQDPTTVCMLSNKNMIFRSGTGKKYVDEDLRSTAASLKLRR